MLTFMFCVEGRICVGIVEVLHVGWAEDGDGEQVKGIFGVRRSLRWSDGDEHAADEVLDSVLFGNHSSPI